MGGGQSHPCTQHSQLSKSLYGDTNINPGELDVRSSGGQNEEVRDCPGNRNVNDIKQYYVSVLEELKNKIIEKQGDFDTNLNVGNTFNDMINNCRTNCDNVLVILQNIYKKVTYDSNSSELDKNTIEDIDNTLTTNLYPPTDNVKLCQIILVNYTTINNFFEKYKKTDIDKIYLDDTITPNNINKDQTFTDDLFKFIHLFNLHYNDHGNLAYIGNAGHYGNNGKLPSNFIRDKWIRAGKIDYNSKFKSYISNYNNYYEKYKEIIIVLNNIVKELNKIIDSIERRLAIYSHNYERTEELFNKLQQISEYFNIQFKSNLKESFININNTNMIENFENNNQKNLQTAITNYEDTKKNNEIIKNIRKFNNQYQFDCDVFDNEHYMYVGYTTAADNQYSSYLLNPIIESQGATIFDKEKGGPLCVKAANEEKCYNYGNKVSCVNHLININANNEDSTFTKEPVFENANSIDSDEINRQQTFIYKAKLWNKNSNLHDKVFSNDNINDINILDDKPIITTATTIPKIATTTTSLTYIREIKEEPQATIVKPVSYPENPIPPGKYHLKVICDDIDEYYLYIESQKTNGITNYNISKKQNRSDSDSTDIFEIGNHYENIDNNITALITIKLQNTNIYLISKEKKLYKNLLYCNNYGSLDINQEAYFKVSNYSFDNRSHSFDMTSALNPDNFCSIFNNPLRDDVFSRISSNDYGFNPYMYGLYNYVNNSEYPKYHCDHNLPKCKFKLVPI